MTSRWKNGKPFASGKQCLLNTEYAPNVRINGKSVDFPCHWWVIMCTRVNVFFFNFQFCFSFFCLEQNISQMNAGRMARTLPQTCTFYSFICQRSKREIDIHFNQTTILCISYSNHLLSDPFLFLFLFTNKLNVIRYRT